MGGAERSRAERGGARSGAATVARQRGLRGEGQRPHLALLGQLPLLARNVRSMSMMPQVRAPRPAPSLACALRPLPPSAHKPRTSRCRRGQCDDTAMKQSRSESERARERQRERKRDRERERERGSERGSERASERERGRERRERETRARARERERERERETQ